MGAGWMIAIFLLLISVKAQLLLLTIEVTDIVSNWISFLEQEFFLNCLYGKLESFITTYKVALIMSELFVF